uniref:PHD-type domain-containing protein n=1 Tax=Auxenochlorella protothecoides TaxID=3075 RepID=A0A1D2A528_AUXPR
MPSSPPTCAFCDEPEGPTHGLGPLLGPIPGLGSGLGRGAYVHRVCAIWSPQVCETPEGGLRGVAGEVRRGRALRCAHCGKRGASLGCRLASCHSSFHVACAQAAGASFFLGSFQVACKAHARLFGGEPSVPKLLGLMLDAETMRPIASPSGGKKLMASPPLRAQRFPGEKGDRAAGRRAEVLQARAALRAWREEERRQRELSSSDEEHLRSREAQREEREIASLQPVLLGAEPQGEGDGLYTRPLTTFADVAGMEGVKAALREMVLLPLLAPQVLQDMGISAPRGILLHGPPGTGKTLIVRALAGECAAFAASRVSLFVRSGADCLGKFHGEAERTLRLLFEEATRRAPSIIFFDELDALAPARTARHDSPSDQTFASVVSTLLCLMDGVGNRGAVVVIGATNSPDSLDPALRRPGRFDREVEVGLPSSRERLGVLRAHTRRWPQPPDPELLSRLAAATRGWAGADLQALAAAAVVRAARRALPLDAALDGGAALCDGLAPPRVEAGDWEAALAEAPPPCAWRAGGAAGGPRGPPEGLPAAAARSVRAALRAVHAAAALPVELMPFLDCDPPELLAALAGEGGTDSLDRDFNGPGPNGLSRRSPFVPSGSALCSSTDLRHSLPPPCIRLLLWGPVTSGSGGAGDVAACLLELFCRDAGFAVHALTLPSLITAGDSRGAEGLAAGLGPALQPLLRPGLQHPSLLHLPDLSAWAVGDDGEGLGASPAWTTFVVAVQGAARGTPALILATARGPADALPHDVQDFFDVQLLCPGSSMREGVVLAHPAGQEGWSSPPSQPATDAPANEALLADSSRPTDGMSEEAMPRAPASQLPEPVTPNVTTNEADLAAGLALYHAELSSLQEVGLWLARDPRLALLEATPGRPERQRSKRRRGITPPSVPRVARRCWQGLYGSVEAFLLDFRAAVAEIHATPSGGDSHGYSPQVAAACALADEVEQRCHENMQSLELDNPHLQALRAVGAEHVAGLANNRMTSEASGPQDGR